MRSTARSTPATGSASVHTASAAATAPTATKLRWSHVLTKLDLGNRTQIALLAHDADLA